MAGLYDNDRRNSFLQEEEDEVHSYRTSQTGMGTAMVNELVKSYGLHRNDDGSWDWSLDNISKAFKEEPIWTTLDYAAVTFAPARFGLAAMGIARGAASAGAIGKGYKALKTGVGTAEQLTAASGALAGKKATSRLGRVFQGFGMDAELAAATEMKLGSGVNRLHALHVPGTERHLNLASPAATNISKEHMELLGRFDQEIWEKRAIVRVAEREKLAEEAATLSQARDLAAEWGAAGMDKTMREKSMHLLGQRIRPRDLNFVLKNEFGDNKAAADAFKKTWGYRNTIHTEMYKLGLISRETYRDNLYKYNPKIYEEWVKTQQNLKKLDYKGDKIPGKYVGPHEPNPTDGPDTTMVKGGLARLQKASKEEPGYTRILDPAISLTGLAQAGQIVARHKYAQGIARSVVSASPTQMVDKMLDILQTGDPRMMLMHGITAKKLAAARNILGDFKSINREVAGEELLDLLGWQKIDVMYQGRQLPGYLKSLPDELKNRWLDPSVAKEVVGGLKMLDDDPHLYATVYKNIVSSFRAGKTAYNPGTHVRNFLGGGIFASLASGDFRSLIPVRGWKILSERGDEYRDLVKSGVLGTSFDLEIHEDLAQGVNLAARTAIDWMPDNVFTKGLKKGAAWLEGAYRHVDDLYKADAWSRKREALQGLNHSREQATNLATIEINKFMPTFLQHNALTDALRKGVPFASFTSESLRIWKNALAEKPHMVYFYNHMASSMSDVFGAMAGYAPHEVEEAKNALPSYLQGKKTLLLPFNVDGQPRFLDLSYMIPMGSISEMESTERLFFTGLMDPTTNPVVNIAAAAATGKDPFSGREIAPNFTERQLGIPVTGERTRQILGLGEHMLQTMLPPLAPPGYAGTNLLEAARGQVSPITGEKLEDGAVRTVLANLAGMRLYTPDVESQIKNVKEDQRRISERVKQSWDRWEFARANGNLGVMETERQRIIAIKTREGHDDPEGYFETSEKKRSDLFSELSTKQLEAILKRAEKLGKLSPRDERVRAELVARYQSRKSKD